MIKIEYKYIHLWVEIFTTLLLVWCPSLVFSSEKEKPYKGYTGTVHQFGFIGGLYNTYNPNYSETNSPNTFHDYGLGAVYNLHDYITRQFAFELVTSINVVTAKTIRTKNNDTQKQKIIWPVDCRFYLGPSEDIQAYIGTGLQWGIFEKATGEYNIITGMVPHKTIHQLGGNTSIGLNIFGPQNYMFHLTIGAKLHFPITDNDNVPTNGPLIDLSKDRGCIILNGGVTVDLDRKKRACIMLNYEYPLGSPKSRYSKADNSFFKRTQTISLGVMFHIGGTR